MLLTKVVPVLLLSLAVSHATNVSYTFNNPNFPNPGTIGSQATFDIQSIMVLTTASTIQVKIKTDYQNANLSPFLPNGSSCAPAAGSECMQVGDFFFTSAGADQYGVAIENHGDPTTPGSSLVVNTALYNVTGGHTYTSDQIFAGSSLIFRHGQTVWINGNTAATVSGDTVTPVSTPLSVNPGANGTNAALYTLVFTINLTSPGTDTLYNMITSGHFGVSYASADCANDIFGATVPEPGSLLLLGVGLAGAGLIARRARIGRKSL